MAKKAPSKAQVDEATKLQGYLDAIAKYERELAEARAEVRANGAKTPPDYLRDAHYPGAAKLGRGSGYRYVLVNGEVTVKDDAPTHVYSGALLRNGRIRAKAAKAA